MSDGYEIKGKRLPVNSPEAQSIIRVLQSVTDSQLDTGNYDEMFPVSLLTNAMAHFLTASHFNEREIKDVMENVQKAVCHGVKRMRSRGGSPILSAKSFGQEGQA